MRAAGFEPEDYESDPFEVWPENWPIAKLFGRLLTQWRAGAKGAIGLDYSIVFDLLDRSGYTETAWWQALDDLQEMERAALNAMREETT